MTDPEVTVVAVASVWAVKGIKLIVVGAAAVIVVVTVVDRIADAGYFVGWVGITVVLCCGGFWACVAADTVLWRLFLVYEY